MALTPEEYQDVLDEVMGMNHKQGPFSKMAQPFAEMNHGQWSEWVDKHDEDWLLESATIWYNRMFT